MSGDSQGRMYAFTESMVKNEAKVKIKLEIRKWLKLVRVVL